MSQNQFNFESLETPLDLTRLKLASYHDPASPGAAYAAEADIKKKGRGNSQLQKLWARLCRGPATNIELMQISGATSGFTARISNLRRLKAAAGWNIVCRPDPQRPGVTRYYLQRKG